MFIYIAPDKEYQIKRNDKVTAKEITELRKIVGWDHDVKEWKSCLKNMLSTMIARDNNGTLIGVGFLIGNVRHAQLVDLVVHPDYRNRGIGGRISDMLIETAEELNVKYFGLTYDTNFPWLKEFYKQKDFETINFALWHKNSIS